MPGSAQDRRISSGLAWTITIACAVFLIHHIVRSRDTLVAEAPIAQPQSFHQQRPAADDGDITAVPSGGGAQQGSGDYLRRMKDMVDGIRRELKGHAGNSAEQVQKLESLQKYLEGATSDPIIELSQPSSSSKPAKQEDSASASGPAGSTSSPNAADAPGASAAPVPASPTGPQSATTGPPARSEPPQSDAKIEGIAATASPPPPAPPNPSQPSDSLTSLPGGGSTSQGSPAAAAGEGTTSADPIVPKVIAEPDPPSPVSRVKTDCAALPQDCPHHRECRFGSAQFSDAERKAIVLNILRAFVNSTYYQKEWFWLHGGTLLGAQRNGKFIQWDDDADLSTTWQTFARILELTAGLDTRFGAGDRFMMSVECHYPDIPARIIDTHNGFYVDIFVFYDQSTWQEVKLKQYQGTRKSPLGPDDFHNPFPFSNGCTLYKRAELFPLRTCRFEGIDLSCPKNTEWFLRRCYGPSWKIPKRWH